MRKLIRIADTKSFCRVIAITVGILMAPAIYAVPVHQTSGVGTAQGQDVPSFVDIDDFVLDADSTSGLWVTLVRDGTVYYNTR